MENKIDTLKEAEESLKRIQEFDPSVLVRKADLGTAKNFSGAVKPAQRLIDLYNRLSTTSLQDFPEGNLTQIKNRANADYQLFEEVLQFDPDKTTAERDALINKIEGVYDQAFNTLHPLIAYSLHRAADFQRLDAEARATLQSIQDQASSLTESLETAKAESERVLDEVRAIAAESGVSQQAFYFKEAADSHEKAADSWKARTIQLAWATGIFAAISLTIHKIPWLAPSTTYDTIQIAVSKILVFAVLSFMLYLSARNFLSSKHNAIVNRHRQQALQTYQALVDAAASSGKSEIILSHAASCIFGPQSTGYAGEGTNSTPSAQTVIEFLGNVSEKSSKSAT